MSFIERKIYNPLAQALMKLKELFEQFTATYYPALEQAQSDDMLEAVRIAYLGRTGLLTQLMDELKPLALEDKKEWGPKLNTLKQEAMSQYEAKKELLFKQKLEQDAAKKANFDVTSYKPDHQKGSLHPYTHIIERIEDIFISMGFARAQGPEVETDFYNFEALNIPANHPARDMQDTFWLPMANTLLRTHTSTMQIRAMRNQKPPIALFAPGRVFRHEATDATHDFMFTQCEGLFVAENVSMANLFATIQHFMQELFEDKNLKIRLRPSYFPFVEPGVEVDISCPFCTEGCSTCKRTRWIELGGAGLVHPNVLKACNIDQEAYSGFAFGFGIERLLMLMYSISDVRILRSGKLEFLRQF